MALPEHGHAFACGALQRSSGGHGPDAHARTGRAAEQDRADVPKRRPDGGGGQIDLDPERLMVIDETWAKTNRGRSHGCCAKGERLRRGFPHGAWGATIVVGALAMRGMIAPFAPSGAIDRDAFAA